MNKYQQKYNKYKQKYLNLLEEIDSLNRSNNKNTLQMYGGVLYKFTNLSGKSIDIEIEPGEYVTVKEIKKYIAKQLGYRYWFFINIIDDTLVLDDDIIISSLLNMRVENSLEAITYLNISFTNYEDSDVHILEKTKRKDIYDIENYFRELQLSDNLRENKQFLLHLVNIYDDRHLYPRFFRLLFDTIPSILKNDKFFMLKTIKKTGDNLRFASIELKDDKEVVLEAIKYGGYCLQYASDNLKNDKLFILEAMAYMPSVFEYIGNELKKDPAFASKSLNQ
jgi:hypothetical protein